MKAAAAALALALAATGAAGATSARTATDAPRADRAAAACAVTRTRTGSLVTRRDGRALSTQLPRGGVLSTQRQADGALWTKLGWVPSGFGPERALTVSGTRLDAPAPPMRVRNVNWGYSSTGRGSWATPVGFAAEGCWRITARAAGLRLSYVTKVVAP